MRHSKRSLEGFLLEDNRASGGVLKESPVATCAHCHAQVVLQPCRTRERGVCWHCDKYLCDGCAFLYARTRECRSFQRTLDRREQQAFKELTRSVTVDPRIILP